LPPTSYSDDAQTKIRISPSKSPKILVLLAVSFKDMMFSISQKDINHLISTINPTGHPSLKFAKNREYLEPQAGLIGFMRNFKFIRSILSASWPSIFSILFTLKTKEIGGRGMFLYTEGVKAQHCC
jgi:hypothetical protein